MPDILLDARTALESAGYRTLFPQPDAKFFYFEDANILGVVYSLESVELLLKEWEHLQDRFLRENGTRLSTDPVKAWNCYTVLLTSDKANNVEASRLFAIEEDFRGTRKIVGAGVTSKSDISQALAPLLPLRRVLSLAPEDIKDRLGSRLGGPTAPLFALLTDIESSAIASNLVNEE